MQEIDRETLERLAEAAHKVWMEGKLRDGVYLVGYSLGRIVGDGNTSRVAGAGPRSSSTRGGTTVQTVVSGSASSSAFSIVRSETWSE